MSERLNTLYDGLKDPWRFLVALVFVIVPFSFLITTKVLLLRLTGMLIFGIIIYVRGFSIIHRDLRFLAKHRHR